MFVSKVRPIGSSSGIIIPKDILESEHIRSGEEVLVSIRKPGDWKRLEALMGTVKEKMPFHRERNDRI